jgi:hypothetical protein
MKWEEIKPGMIIKGEDDKSWLWSIVMNVGPKVITFMTYSQVFSRLRGQGYRDSVYKENLPKSHWSPSSEQVVGTLPNAIKRKFVKKLFDSSLEQEEV